MYFFDKFPDFPDVTFVQCQFIAVNITQKRCKNLVVAVGQFNSFSCLWHCSVKHGVKHRAADRQKKLVGENLMLGFRTFAFGRDRNSKLYITQELAVKQERTHVLDGKFSCLPVFWASFGDNRLISLDTEHFADVCGLRFRVKQVTQ